jgi:hypothetical protein
LSVVLKPGLPYELIVYPEEQLEFTNETVPCFGASVYDRGGNDVTFSGHSPNYVCCQFYQIKQNGQQSSISRQYQMKEGMAGDKRCLILRDKVVISGK